MAFLSMFDMASDLAMIYRYTNSSQKGANSYALATGICVGLSLSIQAIGLFLINRKLPLLTQLREQLFVWTLVKPSIDAFRVATHKEQEAGSRISAESELTGHRTVELVFESIPLTFVQALAIFSKDGDKSLMPILSVTSSVLTSALIATITSYEWDINFINNENRSENNKVRVICESRSEELRKVVIFSNAINVSTADTFLVA